MGKITIQKYTTKEPTTMIGYEAGVCWGADVSNDEKNYKRGIDCLEANHGRTFEFPDIYATIDGYSARVIREWYTHIGGAPTRLQASTRYIDYQSGFDYVIPDSIKKDEFACNQYIECMDAITTKLQYLDELGIKREDSAMLLPLGMETKIVDKRNLRNVIDMSHQRECTRAYLEYRKMFNDYKRALSEYSEEWRYLVEHYFKPKCEVYGYCAEKKPCPRNPKKEVKQ